MTEPGPPLCRTAPSGILPSMPDVAAIPPAAAPVSGSLWRRRVVNPLLAMLRQGVTPEKIALSVSLGCVIGVFPVVGSTTFICVAVAAALRLNQVAMQVGNWVAYPLLLILVIPFVRLGERILGLQPFPLNMAELKLVAEQGARVFFAEFGSAVLHGILGWTAVAPLACAIIFFALLPIFRRTRLGAKPA